MKLATVDGHYIVGGDFNMVLNLLMDHHPNQRISLLASAPFTRQFPQMKQVKREIYQGKEQKEQRETLQCAPTH